MEKFIMFMIKAIGIIMMTFMYICVVPIVTVYTVHDGIRYGDWDFEWVKGITEVLTSNIKGLCEI